MALAVILLVFDGARVVLFHEMAARWLEPFLLFKEWALGSVKRSCSQ